MSNSENIVCFFSFGYSHIFYEKLIHNQGFNDLMDSPNFIFVAPNRTHESFFKKNNFEVFYLSDCTLNIKNKFVESNNLAISTQKNSIINLPARKQESIYYEMNEFIYSVFISKKVTNLIFSQPIEGLSGILLSENAKKLGIKCFVPHSCRFMERSFFSENQFEELHCNIKEVSAINTIKAEQLVNKIKTNKKVQKYPAKSIIKTSFLIRAFRYLKRKILKENIDFPLLKISIENNLSLLYEFKYFLYKKYSNKYFDIKSLAQLHEKIIFFPLQYTPESSINIPNPFFVEQERLIDLIRFSMPDDFLLILKESPSMYGRRDVSFYRNISKKSGVRLASHKLNTFDIISMSNLVISVSGTACLESFILGKPSIVFGKTFFDSFTNIYKIDYNNLKQTIDRFLRRKIDDNEIKQSIAMIIQNTFNFKCGAVDMDPSLISNENINKFVNALKHVVESNS
jgi:hypothetical protein